MENSLNLRRIGDADVSALGFGCMNLSHAYGLPPDASRAAAILRRAVELGVTHFDTAALYGFGANESLIGEVLGPFRSRIHIASKCGMTAADGKRAIDGRPESLKRTLEDSLRRLRTDRIDLYYLHRWDKKVPIEDSVGALADMVAQGKVGAIGLSEVSALTLRRAHAVHPIAAVQSEYSLWSRNVEVAVLGETRRLGAAFVAFSPLARGYLTDSPPVPALFTGADIRRGMPRFQEPNWSANLRLRERLPLLAAAAGTTSARLSLAWLLRQGPHIIPIPGTSNIDHLQDNMGAASVGVPADVLDQLGRLINSNSVRGARYSAGIQAEIDTEEIPDSVTGPAP